MEGRADSPGARSESRSLGGVCARVVVSFACLFVLLVSGTAGLADGQAILATDPSGALVGVNGLVDVDLVISNVENLYGAEVSLSFDPTVVMVIDADPLMPGIQISPGEFPWPDFVVSRTADNEAGTIRYVVTQLSPRTPVSGRGVLATITFAGLKPGETGLDFGDYILANVDGEEIETLPQDGVLTVTLVDPHPVYEVYLPLVVQ